MFLGPWRDTNDPISMVIFTFTMRHQLIRLASAPFTSFRLAKSGWTPFADLRVQRLATKQNAEFTEGGENSVLILAVCGTKFTKFCDSVGDPSCFPISLPDCLWRVLFRRHSTLSLEVVENRTNVKVLAPNF